MFPGPVQWTAKKNHPAVDPPNFTKTVEIHAFLAFQRPARKKTSPGNVTFQAKWWKTIGKTMISDVDGRGHEKNDQGVCRRIPPVRVESRVKTMGKSTIPAFPVLAERISAMLPLCRRGKCNVSSKSFKSVGETSKLT